MAAGVALIVRQGEIKGKRTSFTQPVQYLVGRGTDCDARVPDEPEYQTVSRHHCRFDIDPPQINIRDLGSLNGTFVNGVSIGQRPPGQTPETASDKLSSPALEL